MKRPRTPDQLTYERRNRLILDFIQVNPTAKAQQIAEATRIPLPTVRKRLQKLMEAGVVERVIILGPRQSRRFRLEFPELD